MALLRRNEETLEDLLKSAQRNVDLICTHGYDPERRALELVEQLEGAELCLYKPEAGFKKSLGEYEQRMAAVLKSALESACARHITEKNTSVVRDAQRAMDILVSYAAQAKLKVDHYLISP